MFYYLFLVYGRDGVAKSLFVKKQVVLTKRALQWLAQRTVAILFDFARQKKGLQTSFRLGSNEPF